MHKRTLAVVLACLLGLGGANVIVNVQTQDTSASNPDLAEAGKRVEALADMLEGGFRHEVCLWMRENPVAAASILLRRFEEGGVSPEEAFRVFDNWITNGTPVGMGENERAALVAINRTLWDFDQRVW